MRQNPIKLNQCIDAGAETLEGISLTAIYGSYLKPYLQTWMANIGHFIFFPLFAIAKTIEVILAWRQAYLDRQPRHFVNAVIETISAALLLVATIGGIIASAVFTVASPIIFTALSAGKTVYHAGKALFYGGAAYFEQKPEKKKQLTNIATGATFSALGNMAGTIATAGIFLLGKTIYAIFGIVASVVLASYAIYRGVVTHKQLQKERREKEIVENEYVIQKCDRQNTVGIYKRLKKNTDDNCTDKDTIPRPKAENKILLNQFSKEHLQKSRNEIDVPTGKYFSATY